MSDVLRMFVDRLDTPIGELLIVADADDRLRAVHWTDHEARLLDQFDRQYGERAFVIEPRINPGGLTTAMRAYFAG
ncbi:MAG: methylated-DNA--[protein]-cysteine S-methyltransferase, partial [Vicinamibacterales bacterium]